MTRVRLKLAARLLLVLCGMAALATGLALVLQHRALSVDLERAARTRLAGAAHAADSLLKRHLEATKERYQAISGTPQFRANLEAGDAPTLAFYAKHLAAQQGAALIAFLDRDQTRQALAGDPALAETVMDRLRGAPLGDDARDFVFAHEGIPFAGATIPLRTGARLVGYLVVGETLRAQTIDEWSDLCGARVVFEPPRGGSPRELVRRVRRLAPLEMRVEGTLAAEQEALANSRRNLLTAGSLALALAFTASFLLSRGLVRPILAIQRATERIGRGDLGVRLRSRRRDELGDVARAFDLMLDQLGESIEALRGSERRLARAQHLARLGNWEIDLVDRELHCSAEFLRIYELDPDRPPLTQEPILERIHPEDRERFCRAMNACLQRGQPFQLDHRVILPDGSERVLHTQGELGLGPDGRAARFEGTVQDVTERRAVEEQVRYLAYHDGLTGLGNRKLFRERLALAIAEARRSESVVGVLSLDLDHFKRINDTLGHSVGDQLLKRVADRLVSCVRAQDRFSPGRGREVDRTVARLGGDEFGVLVSDLGNPQDAARIARRVLAALYRPFQVEGLEVILGCSIGIAAWPMDGQDADEILRDCDAAMYHAKEQGRNNYQFYTDSMNALAFKRLVFENKLRQTLERNELELYYQPKLEIASGRVTGVEALVRWNEPELGLVPPGEFIPVAEEMGLIETIGGWTIRAACAQMRSWVESGIAPLRLSVNISGYQIEKGTLLAMIDEALEETGLDPGRLDLEITESMLMGDEEAVVSTLREIKERGISLSLDDFGTGYSSLSYLRRLPIDTLKIDRSFIRPIATDPDDAALTAAIVSMAKVLRLRVVAEGVETGQQREFLRELGCDEMQGYLVSPAVPAERVPQLLKELNARSRKKARSQTGE